MRCKRWAEMAPSSRPVKSGRPSTTRPASQASKNLPQATAAIEAKAKCARKERRWHQVAKPRSGRDPQAGHERRLRDPGAKRKAIRDGVQAKAARGPIRRKRLPSPKIADMAVNEQVLQEHLTGRQQGDDDLGAAARVTQEASSTPWHCWPTRDPECRQGQGRRHLLRERDGDKLGFEKQYQQDTRRGPTTLSPSSTAPTAVIRADGAGMSNLVEQHGSQAIEYGNRWAKEEPTAVRFRRQRHPAQRQDRHEHTEGTQGFHPQLHGKVRDNKGQLKRCSVPTPKRPPMATRSPSLVTSSGKPSYRSLSRSGRQPWATRATRKSAANVLETFDPKQKLWARSTPIPEVTALRSTTTTSPTTAARR